MSAEIDPELTAFTAIVESLTPLDRLACQRVLRWAEMRFVSAPLPQWEPDRTTKFFEALAEASQRMANTTPEDILRAFARIQAASPETDEA